MGQLLRSCTCRGSVSFTPGSRWPADCINRLLSAITGPSAPIFDDLCYQGHYSDPVHGSGIGHRGGGVVAHGNGCGSERSLCRNRVPSCASIRLSSAIAGREINKTEGCGRHTRTSPCMRKYDFMGERDPAEAMEVLDRLLKFFGGGERRVKGRLSARGSVRLSVPNSERTRPTPTPNRRSRPTPNFDRRRELNSLKIHDLAQLLAAREVTVTLLRGTLQ